METKNGTELDGRTLKVDLSAPRAERAPTENKRDFTKEELSEPSTTLFVGNLPFSTTQDSVWEIFAEFGDINSVRLPTDPDTQQIKGFGYVEFADLDSAKAAVEKGRGDGVFIDNRQARLDFSQPRAPGGGGGRGGGGGFGGRGGGRGFGGGRGGFGGDRGGRGGFGDRGRGGGRGFGDRGGRGRGGGGRGRGGGDSGWGGRAKANGSVVESAGTKKKFD